MPDEPSGASPCWPTPPRGPGEWIGRAGEMGVLKEAGALLRRGCPAVVEVAGLPGMGKSELLRQAAGALADQGERFFAALVVPGAPGGPGLALAASVAAQAAGGAPRVWSPEHPPAGPAGEILRRWEGRTGGGVPPAALEELAGLLAERFEGRIMVLLDDADRLWPRAGERSELAAGAGRGRVSWTLALGAGHAGAGGAKGVLRRLEIGPLADDESWELLTRAMAASGVALSGDCRGAAALLGGVPGLIWGAAAAARLSGLSSFESADRLLEFYARETVSGFLRDYHLELVGAGGPAGRVLLEVLLHLAARGTTVAEPEALAREMLREPSEIAPALEALGRAGLARRAWGRLLIDAPATLGDFSRSESRLHLEGCSPREAVARLRLEKEGWLAVEGERRSADRNASEMAAFVASWQGQAMPRSLVDHERFRELFPGGDPQGDTLAARDRARVALLRVADVWPEEFPGSDQVPGYHLDLLALGRGEEGAERWLALDLRLGEAEVTSAMVDDFDRRLRLFLSRAGLRPADVTGWVLSGGTFSAEASAKARKLRLWTSGPGQLRLMAGVSGWGRTMQLVLAPAEAAAEGYAVEVIIPAIGETELVAAKALEQLGEGLPLGEIEIGRVKMALVEACLNAFEHGRGEDRRVHLTMRVRPDRLEIEVFNRGLAFTPERISRPSVEDKIGSPRKRGWGLSLIRELMDELEFVRREDGTLLRMTKYFAVKKTEEGEGRNAQGSRK